MKIQVNSIREYLKKDFKKSLITSISIILIIALYSLIMPTQYISSIGVEVNYLGKHISEEHKKVLEWKMAKNMKDLINENSKKESSNINATYENYTNVVSIYIKGSDSENNNSKLKTQYNMIQNILKNEDVDVNLVNKQIIQTPKIMQNLIISILIAFTVIILKFLIKYN